MSLKESASPSKSNSALLTQREREVLLLIGAGRTNRQIAEALTVSVATAERHVHNILTKLGCANRTEAATYARALSLDAARPDTTSALPIADGHTLRDAHCPYPGLRPFSAQDASTYFGREETIARFLDRLQSRGILAIVGASGSGKSSILSAGMVPALQAGALPGSAAWRTLAMTPGAEPLAELASAVASLEGTSALTVLRDLESDDRALDLAIRREAAGQPEDFRIVLAIDQFEEIFTTCRDRSQQERFMNLVVRAATAPRSHLFVILAIRADFYGECAEFPRFAELLETSHTLLGPLTAEELRAVIELPLEVAGFRAEPGLADRILGDLKDAPGALPLLAHSLRETWQRRNGDTLTIAGYLRTGGIRKAIAQSADQVFTGLSPSEQGICRDLFLRLTEFGDGVDDTRRRLPMSEMDGSNAPREAIRGVLARLADARLITVDADSIEVSHEALIREWPRLRNWVDEDREGLRILRHVTESAQAWERLGRDPGEVYRGARLSTATGWIEQASPSLSPLEREFMAASQALHAKELQDAHGRVRRLRLLASGLAALVMVAAVVGSIALFQWNRANEARSRASADRDAAIGAQANEAEARLQAENATIEATLARLESEIPLLLKSDRSLAFALAAAAGNVQPGARTDSLLNLVLGDDPRYLGRIFPSEPSLAGYDVSPGGKYIALRNISGLLELYDATTRELIRSVTGEPSNLGLNPTFVPDGKSIVSVSYDAARQHVTVVVRVVPTLAEVRRFEFPGVRSVPAIRSFAPDGRLAAVVNGVLHLLDLVDGTDQAVAELPPLAGGVSFDPRGQYLAAQPLTSRDTLGLFDAKTFALLRTFPQITSTLAVSRFTPEGSLLILHFGTFSGNPTRLDVWNPETGELLASAPTWASAAGLALASNGASLAVATAEGELDVLSLPRLEAHGPPFPLLTINYPLPKFGVGDRTIYNHAVAYALEHWDLGGAGLASAYTAAAGPGEIGFAPDGSWFVKQSPDGHWSRWRLPDLALIDRSPTSTGDATPAGGPTRQTAPAVSGDGKYFATGHSDCPRASQAGCAGSVLIWDAATGRPLGQPIRVPNPESLGQPLGLAFHPDQPLLAIHGNAGLVIIVTVEGGSPRVRVSFTPAEISGPAGRSVAFLAAAVAPSPTIITLFSSELSVWDVSDEVPTRLGFWDTAASTRGFTVTPSGEVAILRSSGDLQFFRYEALLSGAQPEPLSIIRGVGPLGIGAALRFSADGRMVALTRADGKVALWDIEEKASLGSNFASPSATSAFPTPDGKSLLVASDNMTILWDLDTALWFEKVCLAAGRNLTEAEWAKYFPGREYESTCDRWPAKPVI